MNTEKCFICTNLRINISGKVIGTYFGFPLCDPHFHFINHQEDKAEAAGNPVWKEIWDDTRKDHEEEVEAAINYIIVLNGNLKGLPKEIHETITIHKLKEKYSEFL
jgi:hypothetical protein